MTNNSYVNYQKCYEIGVYEPHEAVTPPYLLWFAVVHCYSVFVFGTICNAVALWCVVTCTRTRPAVKVLLCSVFLPILVICLVTMPAMGQVLMAIINCDDSRAPKPFRMAMSLIYSSLAQMELFCIAAISLFRTAAVLSCQRQTVGLRVAAGVVAGIFLYSVLTAVGVLGSLILGYIQGRWLERSITILYFILNTMIPVLVTIACNAVMLFAVRRNKRRLAGSQHEGSGATSVVDQATRAMTAVFVSNLLMGIPHSVFHLLENPSLTLDIIFHGLFYTHFVVDPVVFIWYNRLYHQRVGERLRAGLELMKQYCRLSRTISTFHLHSPSTSSTNPASSENERGGSDNMC